MTRTFGMVMGYKDVASTSNLAPRNSNPFMLKNIQDNEFATISYGRHSNMASSSTPSNNIPPLITSHQFEPSSSIPINPNYGSSSANYTHGDDLMSQHGLQYDMQIPCFDEVSHHDQMQPIIGNYYNNTGVINNNNAFDYGFHIHDYCLNPTSGEVYDASMENLLDLVQPTNNEHQQPQFQNFDENHQIDLVQPSNDVTSHCSHLPRIDHNSDHNLMEEGVNTILSHQVNISSYHYTYNLVPEKYTNW